MASIRGGDRGWRRRRRRTRGQSASTEYVDDHIAAGYTKGHSFSSDCDPTDCVRSGRDKVLDDALFGFFMKQAIGSLKRNFTDYCQDTIGNVEVKRAKSDGVDSTVFTRYGPKYFLQVLKKLTPVQKSIIEKFGFGCLLLFDSGHIPSAFARWVVDCIDASCSHITVCDRSFGVSKNTFNVVLGLPIGGMEIPINSDDGRDFILSHFQLSVLPHITFFGNKLSGAELLSELDVFVSFMTVALSCFLCLGLNESVNCSHLAILKDPAAAKLYDFSKLVYDHCMISLSHYASLGKSRGRRMKVPVYCNYVFAVRYLDFLDFGIQNVDQTTPRVLVWKGNMIKVYSDLDCKSHHQFGKKRLKEGFAGYRLQGVGCFDTRMKASTPIRLSPLSSDFKISAHSQFVNSLQADVIDGIVSITDNFALNNSSSHKPKLHMLVSSLLEFLCKTSRPESKVDPNPSAPDANKVRTEELYQKAPVDAMKCFAPALIDTADPATPECMITKVVEGASLMTAPALNAMRKVKARRCRTLSEQDEQNILSRRICGTSEIKAAGTSKCTNGIAEPIKGLIDLSDAPIPSLYVSGSKQPQTGFFNLRRVLNKNGSLQDPIDVPDLSPNPPMTGKHDGPQIVGTNDFRRRCVELSKKTDSTYNNMILSNQQVGNARHAQQNNVQKGEAQPNDNQANIAAPVKRKYRFVNWLVSGQTPPLQLNSTHPVSVEQIIDYSSIVELAHGSIRNEPRLLFQKVHCSYQSLGKSLMPNGEIDNFIIPCFCRMLFEERHPSSSGRHYFFPHIGDAILKYAGVNQENNVRTSFEGASKASKGRNLGHKDNRLFFSIVDSGQWFIFAVDFEYKVFAFLDSYLDKNSEFHLRIKDRLIDNFVHLWEVIISKNHNFANFDVLYPDVPKQKNFEGLWSVCDEVHGGLDTFY